MRTEHVTYELFCENIQAMQMSGEKISVRTVLSHTGGSFAKIAEFLKKWREDQVYAETQKDTELSVNLRQAILAEVGKAVIDTKKLYAREINETADQLKEVTEVLAKHEKREEELKSEVTQLHNQLAAAQAVEKLHLEKIATLEKQVEEAKLIQYAAEKQAAIAETRYVEIEKQLYNQEKQRETTTAKK